MFATHLLYFIYLKKGFIQQLPTYPNSKWPPGSWYVPRPMLLIRFPRRTQPGWAASITSTPTPTPGRFTTVSDIRLIYNDNNKALTERNKLKRPRERLHGVPIFPCTSGKKSQSSLLSCATLPPSDRLCAVHIVVSKRFRTF